VLGFLTSFTAIAIFWQGNHQIFQLITRFDGRLLWLVFLQLLCIAFIPFPTAVLSEHVGDLVAQEFYLGSLLLATLANAALWWYPSWGNRLVVLLVYFMALGYIAIAVFEWWEPREAAPEAEGEATSERPFDRRGN
jgi:hypothetical protein